MRVIFEGTPQELGTMFVRLYGSKLVEPANIDFSGGFAELGELLKPPIHPEAKDDTGPAVPEI